jgi:hypothetical protein
MSNLKSEPLQLTTDREKDLLAEIGRLLLQLRAAELQAHTLQAKLSDLEADCVKQHDCVKGRPSPLAESLTKAFQTAAADAIRTTLDRGGTAVGEVQGQWSVVSKTCEHGNTECQKRGVGQPTRDPRQDLKVGEHVRFEIEGIIKERQSAGIFQDKDGSDFEPIQYTVKDSINGMTYYVGYHQITKVIGKEK